MLFFLLQLVNCFVITQPTPVQKESLRRCSINHRHHHQAAIITPTTMTQQQRQQQQQQRRSLKRSILFMSTVLEEDDVPLSKEEIESLTVPQLKQQLRLRGLKVSGKKQDLLNRLLDSFSQKWELSSSLTEDEEKKKEDPSVVEATVLEEEPGRRNGASSAAKQKAKTKAQKLAEERGKEFIDVTAYLDEDEVGEEVKSSIPVETDDEEDFNPQSENPEVWGSSAKIIDDYEGRTPVVDGLSRTVIEYKGSNQTQIQAFVVASRDALQPFLAGGYNRTSNTEEQLREIQAKREQASRRPLRPDDEAGIDEGDETGIFSNILHRDFSDWGKYSLTGAQLSAQEVQGVLILSDVYGAFSDDTRALAEKIAFECQPVVVMVPDLFRGKPWDEDPTTPGFNEEGQDYEEWRAQHSDNRVSIDIRASAHILREQYGVSSIVVWGTCYGGGRALEVGAGYMPDGKVHDVDGSIGPVPVNPDVVVAWYPTRYDASKLFGPARSEGLFDNNEKRNMAVIGIFAGEDHLSGATAEDASKLKSLFEEDGRVKDFMVKVFPNQGHGFAHIGLGNGREDTELDRFVDDEFGGAGRVSMDDGDAEVACLLSTAFMETYSRKFLPTTGAPISKDERATDWSETLDMQDLSDTTTKDVRAELEELEENFVEEPIGGIRIDQTNANEDDRLASILKSMEPENMPPELKIQDDDDLETIYSKLLSNDPSFQIF